MCWSGCDEATKQDITYCIPTNNLETIQLDIIQLIIKLFFFREKHCSVVKLDSCVLI